MRRRPFDYQQQSAIYRQLMRYAPTPWDLGGAAHRVEYDPGLGRDGDGFLPAQSSQNRGDYVQYCSQQYLYEDPGG